MFRYAENSFMKEKTVKQWTVTDKMGLLVLRGWHNLCCLVWGDILKEWNNH